MKYLVVAEKTDTGFSAYSPDLPGCVATGSTRDEVECEMRAAITFHVEGLVAGGHEVPSPRAFSTYVEIGRDSDRPV